MFRYIFKKLNFMRNSHQKMNIQSKNSQKAEQLKLSRDLNQNLHTIRGIFGSSKDIIIREFTLGSTEKTNGALIFIDGMTDKATINEDILKPLMYDTRLMDLEEPLTSDNGIDIIKKKHACC